MQTQAGPIHKTDEIPDFRLFLQEELLRRCKVNPKYSLRAFAKRLKIGPSFLSKILNGKRSLTPRVIAKLAPELGLNPAELHKLRAQESLAASRDAARFHQLALDSFQLIADWYHYAILELLSVKGFKPNSKWIAKALGITVNEVNFAIERLQRLGMIRIETDGRWANASGNNTTVGNEFTAAAFRKLQLQILDQAKEALENVPMESRDQSSLTMAMDSELLPEAKTRIRKFRRELMELLQQQGRSRDQVYQLSISLFPITNFDTPVKAKGARK